MWNWKPAKMVLEALWDRGVLVIGGPRRASSARYDLAERVIPKHMARGADADRGRDAAHVRAARGRRARRADRGGDPRALAPQGRQGAAAPPPLALVAEGRLREVEVDDGGAPFYVLPGVELDGDPAPPVLVCPFDNLVWDRPLLERLFGFKHLIEVYKREHERAYGYYVLPLLAGDRFLGRADLKADRAEGVLRIRRFTPEPRVRGDVDAKLERAATRLARTLGLERVERAA